MTVEEYADIEIEGALERQEQDEERKKQKDEENESDEEIQERDRQKKSHWDDWKDENPAGAGNTKRI